MHRVVIVSAIHTRLVTVVKMVVIVHGMRITCDNVHFLRTHYIHYLKWTKILLYAADRTTSDPFPLPNCMQYNAQALVFLPYRAFGDDRDRVPLCEGLEFVIARSYSSFWDKQTIIRLYAIFYCFKIILPIIKNQNSVISLKNYSIKSCCNRQHSNYENIKYKLVCYHLITALKNKHSIFIGTC